MNVKTNKVLSELSEVKELFIFPSCGDETNAIGAVWAYLTQQGKARKIDPVSSMYLGPDLDQEQIAKVEELAVAKGYKIEKSDDIPARIAELLAQGEIVARCNGREEFGARALGNRSLLADPSRWETVQVLNDAIKNRDFWMPFACTVLEPCEDQYVDNSKHISAPYMILAFDSRTSKEIIAGTHPKDSTIRPQILRKEMNPDYYRVIEEFKKKTGKGIVLNTSFNLHGEPMVSSAVDAFDVLARSGLKYLAVGPFFITKSSG